MHPLYNVLVFGTLAAAAAAPPTTALLASRPLTHLGKVSFGMHLLHPFAFRVVMQRYGKGWASLGKAVLLSAAVATLSLYAFEEASTPRLEPTASRSRARNQQPRHSLSCDSRPSVWTAARQADPQRGAARARRTAEGGEGEWRRQGGQGEWS